MHAWKGCGCEWEGGLVSEWRVPIGEGKIPQHLRRALLLQAPSPEDLLQNAAMEREGHAGRDGAGIEPTEPKQ